MTIEELKKLQNQIIEKEKKYNLIGGITYLALIIPSIIMMIIWKSDYFSIIIFLMIISIIFDIIFFPIKFFANNKEKVAFNNEFKKIFVFNSLSKYFKNLKYLPNSGISKSDIDSYFTLDTADSFSSNDYVSGLYKDIKFEQSDVLIREREEETDADGNTRTVWETIFEGRYMIFDFNKEFKSNVKVVTKRFEANRFSWGKKMSKVKMEDVEFNKMFAIFAENDHEAFYILTPTFMEKMKNIYNKLKTPIMFCFLNNKLHIAIDNRVYKYKPSKLILLIGINDLTHFKDEEYVSKNIEKITDKIHKKFPKCKIYIESIYPINNTWKERSTIEVPSVDDITNKIKNTNKKIKQLCKKNGYTYINMFDLLKDDDDHLIEKYTNDGIHPNEEGYNVITNKIKEVLK